MKTILYLVLFSMTTIVLLACGGDEKGADDKVGAATNKVVPTEKAIERGATAEQAKKEVAVDPALSAKLEAGEKLVKAHCSSCHQTEMYTRAESKIKSTDALLARVKACDANIGSGLFDEDMEAITAYLEVNFYKFAQ